MYSTSEILQFCVKLTFLYLKVDYDISFDDPSQGYVCRKKYYDF